MTLAAPPPSGSGATAGSAVIIRLGLSLLAGLAIGLFLYLERGFFPQHAVLSGVSVGILTFMALRTAARLVHLWRR
jgi:hypothetical protein